ncbi:MAG: hypothetical protein LBP27_04245 [Treponema sp.]|jgi:hypothetical protein|nr:hypothetical protein [Treponema sp.]
MDYKKVFEKFKEQNVFLKTASPPPIDGARRAALNRKGNALFNSGDIEAARRIFLTTGYSDGISRVGDYYKSQGKLIDALRMYWIAPDHAKSEPIIMQLSGILRNLIHKEEEPSDE